MAAVLSPNSPSSQAAQSPASSSPPPSQSQSSSSLPPLKTSTSAPVQRRSGLQRPPSYAKHRLSGYSNISSSNHSQPQSRPASNVFPLFPSSLSYAGVRDFAYPVLHPMHYGPPPEPSGAQSVVSTPISENRRLSDPAGGSGGSWESSSGGYFAGPWGGDGTVPGESYSAGSTRGGPSDGGPPYSEDDDLHSPIVKSSRHGAKHKKHKSALDSFSPADENGPGPVISSHNFDAERGYFAGSRADGSETYYVNAGDESADGPGGEFVTYPPNQARHSMEPLLSRGQAATTLPNSSYGPFNPAWRDAPSSQHHPPSSSSSSDDEGGEDDDDGDSRYSRDYQFTIASPDEEMHGKAVALFDFERENENELPLVEGQIIWVSYRHGQGWLVAEDPRTHESGLVPEEYVRLLRDIEGGLGGLTGELNDVVISPATTTGGGDAGEVPTPTATSHAAAATAESEHVSPPATAASPTSTTSPAGPAGPATQSTFSTSSKDLNPFPHHLLNNLGGHPPQVVHYHGQPGSGSGTPTLGSPRHHPLDEGLGRSGSGRSGRSARSREELESPDTPTQGIVSEKGVEKGERGGEGERGERGDRGEKGEVGRRKSEKRKSKR